MTATTLQWMGAGLFAVAILHTFSTRFFEHLAHTRPAHAGIWHLLGEVEVVFGFWALILMGAMFLINGAAEATAYIDSRNFTEPLFVFAIMVIAASRPILQAAMGGVRVLARWVPLPGSMGSYVVVLSVVPLLGSFITEPAAMTLAALILAGGHGDPARPLRRRGGAPPGPAAGGPAAHPHRGAGLSIPVATIELLQPPCVHPSGIVHCSKSPGRG